MRRNFLWIFAVVLFALSAASAGSQRFPPPDFESGYQIPETETPAPDGDIYEYIAIAVLAAALGLGSYLVYKKRSRRSAFVLMLFSLAFFGFWRLGCICPIGATQNMALSIFDSGYAVPITVLIIFLLPLIFALFYGRIFCGTVCPLGAIQDIVLFKPVAIPFWLESSIRILAYIYLGSAILLAVTGAGFLICRYDPFVSFFRLSGSLGMLALGTVFLIIGLFIGRPYCRFLCPYGIFLRHFSRLSKTNVQISPDDCINCRLCEDSCPFGAIRKPTGNWPANELTKSKKTLVLLIFLTPVIILLTGWAFSNISDFIARSHHDVSLADRVYLEQTGQVSGTTDASAAFYNTGENIESLYKLSVNIQDSFHTGSWILGGFIGFVIAATLIKHTIKWKKDYYYADPGDCLACGRCYDSCPREHVKIKELHDSKQVVYND